MTISHTSAHAPPTSRRRRRSRRTPQISRRQERTQGSARASTTSHPHMERVEDLRPRACWEVRKLSHRGELPRSTSVNSRSPTRHGGTTSRNHRPNSYHGDAGWELPLRRDTPTLTFRCSVPCRGTSKRAAHSLRPERNGIGQVAPMPNREQPQVHGGRDRRAGQRADKMELMDQQQSPPARVATIAETAGGARRGMIVKSRCLRAARTRTTDSTAPAARVL